MSATVAIVDYGLGNLYSVKLACEHVGLEAEITSDRTAIEQAEAVILPGVGAFGDAMDTLRRHDLVSVLRDVASSGKPFMGICLGLQLLMDCSEEFGSHEGLGIIKGNVVPLVQPEESGRVLKVPQVGWNHVEQPGGVDWNQSLLAGVAPGERFYFVHSYVVQPQDNAFVHSTTRYGHIEFCSSLQFENIFACQFHPERSGELGLQVYFNLAAHLTEERV